MNRERLEHLITVISKIPKENLSLKHWVSTPGNKIGDIDQKSLVECGTVCCAVGWACSDPIFNEQGLVWDYMLQQPRYKYDTSWTAAMEFFDITFPKALRLFDWESYDENVTPEDIIAHIKVELQLDRLSNPEEQ